jgi:hypothetical protein
MKLKYLGGIVKAVTNYIPCSAFPLCSVAIINNTTVVRTDLESPYHN